MNPERNQVLTASLIDGLPECRRYLPFPVDNQ